MKRKSTKSRMAYARKFIKRKYRGYGSRRSFKADRKRKAKNRPAKKYRRGIGNLGDW